MSKKNIMMWVLCILCWVFCFIAIAVSPYSNIAWWVMISLQISCIIGQLIIGVFIVIDFKKQEKELTRKLEEDQKRLEELIKGYLTASLEEDNKEE